MERTNPTSLPDSGPRRGLQALLGLVAILFVLRLFAAILQVPPFLADGLSLVLSAVFIVAPILGLFFSADHPWNAKTSAILLLLGVLTQFGGTALAQGQSGLLKVGLVAMAQSGLVVWCFGLGALIASLLKDKNLLLPVAVFLAGFDVFLVTYPLGTVQQVLQKQPEIFTSVAYSVPKAAEAGQAVGVNIGAYVGPADFIFLSMFFVCLFKFAMRTRQTLPWMVGALLVYLFVVLLFGDSKLGPISLGALPALLPIGLVVLLVNLPEFKLKRDEWAGTAVVGLLAIGLAVFGVNAAANKKPVSPPAPAPSAAAPGSPAPQGTPNSTSGGQLPSGSQTAPGSTPNPR